MTISMKKITISSSVRPKLSKDKLTLIKNEIHLWINKPYNLLLSSDKNEELLIDYHTLLTPEERRKQKRYKFAKDRHDALITRVFIRDLLSYYADVAPQDWQFEKGIYGKPEIVNPPLPLRFNISHTKNLIICAVTLNDDIGCDGEKVHRNFDVLPIAEHYFSPQETIDFFSLPTTKQLNRFFDYWTLKESYIKAWGLGLTIPLADFSFNITDVCSQQSGNFTIKSDVQLSFAKHREDNSLVWRSWLLNLKSTTDHKEQHKIAISLRAKSDNQAIDYQLPFFDSIPLVGYQAEF
jgi:4'-phosphopantetheinyl transferase